MSVTLPPRVVALVGMPAAGKSTVSQALRDRFGFNWIRSRDIVSAIGSPATPSSDLQQRGLDAFSGDAAKMFCEALFGQVKTDVINVVDAIRPINHWTNVVDRYGDNAQLVAVSAPANVREQRIIARDGGGFSDRELHSVEREVPTLMESAHYTINNIDDLEFRLELLVLAILRRVIGSPLKAVATSGASQLSQGDRVIFRRIIDTFAKA